MSAALRAAHEDYKQRIISIGDSSSGATRSAGWRRWTSTGASGTRRPGRTRMMDMEEARRIQVGEPWQEELVNLVHEVIAQECELRALKAHHAALLAEAEAETARLKEALSYKMAYPKYNEVYKRLRYAAPLAAYDVEKHLADLLEHEGMEGYLEEERRWVERLLAWLHRYRRALEALAP